MKYSPIFPVALAGGVLAEQICGHSREHVEPEHKPIEPYYVFQPHLAAVTQSAQVTTRNPNLLLCGVTE